MHSKLQRKIVLEQRRVSDGSHPWCLKEIGIDETNYIERWVPARSSYYFTASSVALNTSLSTDASKETGEQSFLDEVIGARLYPGILRHGSLKNNYRFSTLGTNRTVEVFPFYLKAHEGDETDNKCFIRYLGDQDQPDLDAVSFEIHLSLPAGRFDLFRQMITAKAVNTFELILVGVSGFYKDEFSIGSDRKLLTNDVRATIKSEGPSYSDQEFDPDDTGTVQEWDISLEHQITLEKLTAFSKTALSGNPSVDSGYIQQSVKPYLKDLQEREAQQQVRSDLHDIILRTAKKIAEYSNSVGESRINYKKRLADGIDLIKSIQSAIYSEPISDSPTDNIKGKEQETDLSHSQQALWSHGNLHAAYERGWESSHHKKIDKDALEHEAVKYLQRSWMWDDNLEWVMIDALMFSEAIEYGEYIKQNLPRHMNSRDTGTTYFSAKGNLKKMAQESYRHQIMKTAKELLFFIILPLSLVFYFWNFKYQDIVIWGGAFYIASLALYATTKFLGRSDGNRLDVDHEERYSRLIIMRNVYAELNTGVINPSYLRERLLDTAGKGVVWSGAIFSLIDNVIERSPLIWTHRGDPFGSLSPNDHHQ